LDDEYKLKIADFGLAALLAGSDGSGYLRTKVGTENYMSPEVHAGLPYAGASNDIFAAGIILFIMLTMNLPFILAKPTDQLYNLICKNQPDKFWKAHSNF